MSILSPQAKSTNYLKEQRPYRRALFHLRNTDYSSNSTSERGVTYQMIFVAKKETADHGMRIAKEEGSDRKKNERRKLPFKNTRRQSSRETK